VYSCSFIALLLIPITVIVIKKNTHIKQLLNNPHRFFSFHGFLASVLVGMVAYMIRYLVLNYSSMDLFDILTNSYEGLIFYSGLGGLRYTIRGLLDSITFKMDANPGGGAANPNTGVGEPVQGTSSGSAPAQGASSGSVPVQGASSGPNPGEAAGASTLQARVDKVISDIEH
jgi:hypothetical protein